MTHKDLVNAVLLYLSRVGLAWVNQTGVAEADGRVIRFGFVGSPDVIGMVRGLGGRFIGVECKTGSGTQSKPQRIFEATAQANGGIYILARDVEDVRNRLRMEGLNDV